MAADWSKSYTGIVWQNGTSPHLEADNLNYNQEWIEELVERTEELNDEILPERQITNYVATAQASATAAGTSATNAGLSATAASTSATNAENSKIAAKGYADEAERQAHLAAGANGIDYDVDTSTLSLKHDNTVLDTTTIVSGGSDVDIVTSWEASPSDAKVPSEKLVKTSLESLNDDLVPQTRTICGKALSSDITLTASDVGVPANGVFYDDADPSSASVQTMEWKRVSSMADVPTSANEVMISADRGSGSVYYATTTIPYTELSTSQKYYTFGGYYYNSSTYGYHIAYISKNALSMYYYKQGSNTSCNYSIYYR